MYQEKVIVPQVIVALIRWFLVFHCVVRDRIKENRCFASIDNRM